MHEIFFIFIIFNAGLPNACQSWAISFVNTSPWKLSLTKRFQILWFQICPCCKSHPITGRPLLSKALINWPFFNLEEGARWKSKIPHCLQQSSGLRSAIINIADGWVLLSQVFTWKQVATRLSKNWHKAVATMSSSYGQAAAKLTVGFHKIFVKLWPSSLQKIIKMS